MVAIYCPPDFQDEIGHLLSLISERGSSSLTPTRVLRYSYPLLSILLQSLCHATFLLYNIWKVRLYLHSMQPNQPNYMPWLSFTSTTAALKPKLCLIFNDPKKVHISVVLTELHWLQVSAHIKPKSLILCYSVCRLCSHQLELHHNG